MQHYYAALQFTVQFYNLFVAVCDGGTYFSRETHILKLKLSLYILFTFHFKKLFWTTRNVLELGQ